MVLRPWQWWHITYFYIGKCNDETVKQVRWLYRAHLNWAPDINVWGDWKILIRARYVQENQLYPISFHMWIMVLWYFYLSCYKYLYMCIWERERERVTSSEDPKESLSWSPKPVCIRGLLFKWRSQGNFLFREGLTADVGERPSALSLLSGADGPKESSGFSITLQSFISFLSFPSSFPEETPIWTANSLTIISNIYYFYLYTSITKEPTWENLIAYKRRAVEGGCIPEGMHVTFIQLKGSCKWGSMYHGGFLNGLHQTH